VLLLLFFLSFVSNIMIWMKKKKDFNLSLNGSVRDWRAIVSEYVSTYYSDPTTSQSNGYPIQVLFTSIMKKKMHVCLNMLMILPQVHLPLLRLLLPLVKKIWTSSALEATDLAANNILGHPESSSVQPSVLSTKRIYSIKAFPL